MFHLCSESIKISGDFCEFSVKFIDLVLVSQALSYLLQRKTKILYAHSCRCGKVGVGFVEEFDRALMALDLTIAPNNGI